MDEEIFWLIQKAVSQARVKRKEIEHEYVPPSKGYANARLVGYFEIGKHEEEFEGKTHVIDKVNLIFELSGPDHPQRKLEDGTFVPHRVIVQEALSTDPWSSYCKLFAMMNEAHGNFAVHMVEFLDKAFIVEVFHRRGKHSKTIYANLKGPCGYNIRGVSQRDEDTGEVRKVDVLPAVTELKAFIWDVANRAMWDSIYIPGFYDEAKDEEGNVVRPKTSKNVLQDRIMSAVNWPEHPLAAIVGDSAGT